MSGVFDWGWGLFHSRSRAWPSSFSLTRVTIISKGPINNELRDSRLACDNEELVWDAEDVFSTKGNAKHTGKLTTTVVQICTIGLR